MLLPMTILRKSRCFAAVLECRTMMWQPRTTCAACHSSTIQIIEPVLEFWMHTTVKSTWNWCSDPVITAHTSESVLAAARIAICSAYLIAGSSNENQLCALEERCVNAVAYVGYAIIGSDCTLTTSIAPR